MAPFGGTAFRRAALLLAVWAALAAPAQPLPQRFIASLAAANCTEHPLRAYGPHAPPIPDT